jgi:hypothetical protein
MSKIVFDFSTLDSDVFQDAGSGVIALLLDGAGGLAKTASGLKIDTNGVTNDMLAGSIASSKLTDEALIAYLNQAETISGAWDFTTVPTLDADATTADQAVRLSQLQALVAGLVWLSPNAAAKDYVGNLAASAIEAITPPAGRTYVVTTADGAGDLSGAAVGDVVEYDGANWQIIITNAGGFVPDGTRLLVHDETITLVAPLTDGTDESKYVDFDGTSNTPATLTAPVEGNVTSIGDSDSVNLGNAFQWNSGTNVWFSFNAGATDHGALTGLSDDDHTIYALLAGRSGGQTLIGGTDASDNLTLQSTSNATRGSIVASDNFEWQGQTFQSAINTLTDAANIATDCNDGNIHTVTLTDNRTLDNPTNLEIGTYVWLIVQDGTGSRTLAFGAQFRFAGGGTPALSSTAGAIDVITGVYDGTDLRCSIMTQDDLGVATHAGEHINGGSDQIDGDKLHIDFTPTNYTPTTAPAESDDVDDLTAHLAGLDAAVASINPVIPAPYWHTVTAGEVTNGYLTLSSTPSAAGKVTVHAEGGPVQVNKQTMAGGMTGDYDVGVDGGADRLSINNNGSATALSGDLSSAGLNLYIVFEG